MNTMTMLELIAVRITARCPLCGKRLLFKPIHYSHSARKFAEDDPPLTHVGCSPIAELAKRMKSIPAPDMNSVDRDDRIIWSLADSKSWIIYGWRISWLTEKKIDEWRVVKACSSCPSSTISAQASINESGIVTGEIIDTATGVSTPFAGPDTIAGMIKALDAEMVRMKVGAWQG